MALNIASDGKCRRYAQVLGAVVLLAALIRIVSGVVHNPGELLYSDMANYDAVAQHLQHGRLSAQDTFHPIGYPAFLAAVYAFTNRSFMVVALLQALLGAATCGLVAAITVRLTASATAGLVASTAAMVYPPFVYYGAMLLTESIAPFWLTLSVWLLLRALDEPAIHRTAAAGVTLGIATLIRPNILVVYPLIGMVSVHAQMPNRARGLRTAAQIIAFAAPLLIGAAALNSALTGRVAGLSTNGGINFFLMQADVNTVRYGRGWVTPLRNERFSEVVNSPVPFWDEPYFYREGVKAFRSQPDKIRHMTENLSEGMGLGFQAYWPANELFDFDDGTTYALLRRVMRWCSRAFFWLLVLPIVLDVIVQALGGRLWLPLEAPTLLGLSIIIGIVLTSALFLADPRMHVPFDAALMAFATAGALRLGALVASRISGRKVRGAAGTTHDTV